MIETPEEAAMCAVRRNIEKVLETMTKAEWERRAGLSTNTIGQILRGGGVKVETLAKLAAGINRPITFFFKG